MRRTASYRVQTRNTGEPWRTLWSGPGEETAVEAAKKLGAETRTIQNFMLQGKDFTFPVHQYIRVQRGAKTVFEITPLSRRARA